MLGGFNPDNVLAVAPSPTPPPPCAGPAHRPRRALRSPGSSCSSARRRAGARPLRRSAALLVDSFSLALVMSAVLLIAGAFFPEECFFLPVQRATFVVIGLAPIAFLIALLDARLARSSVGELLVELRAEPAPTDLSEPLARALHDPSLTLAYWLPQYASWTDPDGRPVRLPGDDDDRATTLIERDGEPIAALDHDPALNDEPELLDAVSAAAAIALENGQLHAELKARLEELRGSRGRVIEAGQQERKRLERNLHDGAQQRLIALSLELGRLGTRLRRRPRGPGPESRRRGGRSRSRSTSCGRRPRPASGGAQRPRPRGRARVARGDLGGARAARRRARGPGRRAGRGRRLLRRQREPRQRRQARAGRVGDRRHRADNGELVVEVVDDGVGGADTESGSGLRGLADRVEALGGRLRVWTPRGGGTRVRAEMPCA